MADRKNRMSVCVRPFIFVVTSCTLHVAQAQHMHRTRDVRVAPADEITVIDPGTSSEAKPEPVINNRCVEIPPTLLVHNCYYTGDRDFRGPVFPGGPSIVIVEHPKTGVRMYLDVQMLPGSPRVVYRSTYIDYHFGAQRIRIQFCNPLDPLKYHVPSVRYCRGDKHIQKALGSSAHQSSVKQWIDRTGLPQAVKHVSTASVTLLNRTADGIRQTGEIVVMPVKLVTQSTPLGALFESDPEGEATRARDAAVSQAQNGLSQRDLSIPTLR
ncbi:MAG: hypothetical protein P8J37_08195 [Fuerstiella sp.]|nr:hypothetical protein [Fuerstiella sp.]